MEIEFINLTKEQIAEFRAKYPGNKSVQTLLDGVVKAQEELANKAKAELEATLMVEKIKEDFTKAVDALLVVKTLKVGKDTITTGLPKPPTDIHNLYLAWKEVETPTGPEVATEVTKLDGTKVVEMRQPTTKEFKWVVEVNKGFPVSKTTTSTTTDSKTISKRAITVNKRDGQTLKLVGNFKSGSDACKYLKLDAAGDSATRVLTREGYILDPYTGTDYTA